MFERLEECPSCGHTKFHNHLIVTDHSISGESFALMKCSACELIFTNPRPSQDSIAPYYVSPNYTSHSNKINRLLDVPYKFIQWINTKRKLQLVVRLNQGKGTILDFGCGTGHFLNNCKNNGWKVSGVEPNEKARQLAEQKAATTIHSELKTLRGPFDIITAWHVIEHVHELKQTLKQLKSYLSDNGFLVIAVPNYESFDGRYYKEHWAGFDVPRHLYHFTQKSFLNLAENLRFKVDTILPMKFDSYYVSILSEKYVGTTANFFQGIRKGYQSNVKAKRTGEYSSLIFILSK